MGCHQEEADSKRQEKITATNTENLSRGRENQDLIAAHIAQLVAVTVEQVLDRRSEANPPPDPQIGGD
ncbi:1-acyl-sn-glycerol-3-phosphate acyltransferase [Dorcoceras hygrometricum]|uniref:1-acyl-sn-glycerol-3-phosphate acyltransferase n=1 Tax=Dorcoceras hygrometricum TaxID=472368 RepID=A0A2Z7BFE3_9LAMI|nr:1-acyl-sn-glycerol-3-phosphate acyltransferase [Dorcoceras hygrometricum]